jgi:hypothetical protein
MSPRVELARRVLETLILGDRVSTSDALQLRNWALCPEDSMLTLEEIAIRILNDDKVWRSKGIVRERKQDGLDLTLSWTAASGTDARKKTAY